MQVLHISAECYPAAKAGGLGDVVGALPKYLNSIGRSSGVIIPKYNLKWIQKTGWSVVHQGTIRLHNAYIPFAIEKANDDTLGYPLFVAHIPGKYDRDGIYADPNGYGYGDEVERALCFQMAVLQWVRDASGQPEVLHCHDHHTGLIPFMVKYCPEFQSLAKLPTMFTIHNGQYHGSFRFDKMYLLPFFEARARGILEWAGVINPLATAIKCAWRVSTVSPSYLHELTQSANGIEPLVQHEWHKCLGILNGIDTKVWDPSKDTYLEHRLRAKQWNAFKDTNKKVITDLFGLSPERPLVTFIGRLVTEKGADLLPDLLERVIRSGIELNFAILGTGMPWLHDRLAALPQRFPGRIGLALQYNEGLAHQLYAGADFIFMPSRVEPCGLNQMYAMRYGTVPIVRAVGGLRDTVPDIGEPDGSGRGIQFRQFNLDDAHLALYRAAQLYHQQPQQMTTLRKKISEIDFSWERAAAAYGAVYDELRSV